MPEASIHMRLRVQKQLNSKEEKKWRLQTLQEEEKPQLLAFI